MKCETLESPSLLSVCSLCWILLHCMRGKEYSLVGHNMTSLFPSLTSEQIFYVNVDTPPIQEVFRPWRRSFGLAADFPHNCKCKMQKVKSEGGGDLEFCLQMKMCEVLSNMAICNIKSLFNT